MNGYGCNFCDQPRPVVWLITSLANGETLASCAEDFPVVLILLLADELGVDPGKFYDVVKRFVDREAAREAKAAAKATPPTDEPDPANMTDAEYYGPGHVDDGQADEHEETGMFHGAHEEAL